LLLSGTDSSTVAKIVQNILDGSLYAHRETLESGYISLANGVRVGVCGQARYDEGRLVGISDVSSLVFRIPADASGAYSSLYKAFLSARRGMLIYSLPGVGKTTALRELTKMLGGNDTSLQVAVVDERREFIREDYSSLSVDILTGYKKAKGAEIALRTLSPDIIVIDEIGSKEEAQMLLGSLSLGVRLLASAHAKSKDELYSSPVTSSFMELDIFDVFCRIERNKDKREIFIE
jgi:stage III sporulation protein AA